MNRLLLIELRRLVPTFFLLYLFSTLLLYWNLWFFLISIPATSVIISSQILKRSAWYLNLPWSRAKIISSVLYQNFIIFILNLALTSVIFVFEGKLFFGEEWHYNIIAGLLYSGIGFILCSFRILAGISIRKQMNLAEMEWPKLAVRLGASGLFVLVLWQWDLFDEPVLSAFGTTFFIFSLLVSGFCLEFILPFSTKETVVIFSRILGSILFVSILGCAIGFAHFANPKLVKSSHSLGFLGRFPSFISDQRAVELFVSSRVGSSPSMSRHLKALKEDVTFDLWQKRTAACKDSDCLNLSADAVDIEKLSQSEIEQRFLSILNLCKFSTGRHGKVTCSGEKLSEERLKDWLGLLEKQGTLNQWLTSEDPMKQIVAMKGLPFGVSDEQKRTVETLSGSADPLVKATAVQFLVNLSEYKKLALDCHSEKDRGHAVCRAKEQDYEM